MTVSSAPTLYMGGVIGKVTNTTQANNVLGLLTNEGTLTAGEMKSASKLFMELSVYSGLAYEMNLTFGLFTNKGVIDVLSRGSNIVNSASILVSNHLKKQSLFTYLMGKLNYTINQLGVKTLII